MTALHSIPLTLIDGTETDFGRFKGEVVLVVNVASQCGFTPQYAGLEALHNKFRDQGFQVLGVPCNQFAGQEPGADAEIAEFCQRNFGVTFPLTAKANVRGKNAHPLYTELTKFKNGILPGPGEVELREVPGEPRRRGHRPLCADRGTGRSGNHRSCAVRPGLKRPVCLQGIRAPIPKHAYRLDWPDPPAFRAYPRRSHP